ncbi:nostrin isoform X1 [Leptinotarsa decemlineata]|uniref:nostrin isoform X1 n=1 Tax=Leptinotarsa decemlineata TaxID=7539 RepID=UPI003D3048F2
MKKFISKKINTDQWRVVVPNLNSSIFRKSPSKEEDKSDKESKRSSGFYDFQEAQSEYDKSRSLPNSVYVDTGSSEEDEEEFQDATNMSNKSSSKNKDNSDTDMELYQDVETSTPKIVSKNIDQNNSKFEYDVPRISFKFFEKQKEEAKKNEEALYENEKNSQELATVSKSEIKIVLSTPEDERKIILEAREEPARETPVDDDLPVCHPTERFVSHTEIFVKSLENIEVDVIKSSGSDPILVQGENETIADDGLYQIPRSLKKTHRLSRSLTDFELENIENPPDALSSSQSSIEHISVSQVFPRSFVNETSRMSSETVSQTDSKMRFPRIKKSSILIKPKAKWNDFRNKISNIMIEHASQQRVGAFSDREKVTINLEEMYKNSKTKCKKVLRSTSKIFQKKKHGLDDTGSRVVRKNQLTASDIEYRLNYSDSSSEINDSKLLHGSKVSRDNCTNDRELFNDGVGSNVRCANDSTFPNNNNFSNDEKGDFDVGGILSSTKRKVSLEEGQNGFEDLRRYVKQGGDFCKELSTILQERAEAETQYAKNLSKLSVKLSRACREGVGGLNEAWKSVALELESRAEGHRLLGLALLEETAKPLRTLTESQHRIRKQSEAVVDKAAKNLSDWRTHEAKGKKNSHTCARENEKLQDAAVLDTTKLSKSTSLIHLAHINRQNSTDKENAKLEGKKRKAEDAVKKADVEYYSLCVKSERARLEWESAVLRGASTFQALEEERLNNLKSVLTSYLHHSNDLGPRLIEATERLKGPVTQAEPTKDLCTFQNLRHSSQQVAEQLLPDFYCEHVTLAMNRERRKQALVKLLHLIRQDIERERKSKNGLEVLSKAIKQTPSFGSEDSQQSVIEKLHDMTSMLIYLEGAKYKVQSTLAELDSRPKTGHPLAPHITITRDKSGLQQSILKVPQWLRDEWCDGDKSPVSEKSTKSEKSDNSDPHINDVYDQDWLDRGAADGNSNQPDSDFDEFSSQCSSSGGNICSTEESPVQPIGTCRAIYPYTPNMNDELALKPGDILSVYRQQDDGWWLGECNGNVGIFPATYVEVIKDC